MVAGYPLSPQLRFSCFQPSDESVRVEMGQFTGGGKGMRCWVGI